jgi:hypothetical protein
VGRDKLSTGGQLGRFVTPVASNLGMDSCVDQELVWICLAAFSGGAFLLLRVSCFVGGKEVFTEATACANEKVA